MEFGKESIKTLQSDFRSGSFANQLRFGGIVIIIEVMKLRKDKMVSARCVFEQCF